MTPWLVALAVGVGTGVLTACGLGGGSLLLLYLLEVMDIEQTTAQGVNLLFFLPTALISLPSHLKSGFVERKILLPCVLWGVPFVFLGAYLANKLETSLLRKIFALLLLWLGGTGLLSEKAKIRKKAKKTPETTD